MTRLDDIPFLFVRPRYHNGQWAIMNPIRNVNYTVDYANYSILKLCDGYRTFAEIAEELDRSGHSSAERLISDSGSLLGVLSADGMLWWRQQRMNRRQMSPPTSIIWELTDRCNLSCRHCAVDANHQGNGELNLDECINLINDMASIGVERIVMTGGEPLIRSDFFEIAQECVQKNLHTQVATNATLVTKEIAQELADLRIDAQVSLDGATPNVHELIRQGSGSWSATIRGIKHLVEAGVRVTIATLLVKYNIHEIIPIVDLIGALGAYRFRLLPFLRLGRGALLTDFEVHPIDVQALVARLLKLRSETHVQIASMEFECTFDRPSRSQTDPETPIGCDGARQYCTITSSGDVLPCSFFRGASADNVKDQGFGRIWRNSRFLNYFRSLTVSDIKGKCQQCEWLFDCRGGCVAANYLEGDIFQSNVRCWLNNIE
ncbi:MAG: radical SAM protein [Candidatus Thorarchaeota archaeon]